MKGRPVEEAELNADAVKVPLLCHPSFDGINKKTHSLMSQFNQRFVSWPFFKTSVLLTQGAIGIPFHGILHIALQVRRGNRNKLQVSCRCKLQSRFYCPSVIQQQKYKTSCKVLPSQGKATSWPGNHDLHLTGR